MKWRIAESLLQLRSQINAAHPKRSKLSDGNIGDAAHATRDSDHNPHVKDGKMGVVTAVDVTHDPKNGCDATKIAAALVESRDDRIKYLIWNRSMVSSYPSHGTAAWTWRGYSGANPHNKHLHISVIGSKSLYDSTDAWALSEPDKPIQNGEAKPAPEADSEPAQQNVESGGAATQVVVSPQEQQPAPAPIVSKPTDIPIEATTGGFKSMVTSAVGWITGAGAGLIALLKDNQTLLIIAAVVLVLAGLAYFIRQLILDRDRLRIAADPTKYSAR